MASSGPYRAFDKDSSQGQYSPGEKGIIHHTRKGRVRDASIEIATCFSPNDVTATDFATAIRYLILTGRIVFGPVVSMTKGPGTVTSCRMKSLNGSWEQKDERTRRYGTARNKYSMRILWKRYFIFSFLLVPSVYDCRDMIPGWFYTFSHVIWISRNVQLISISM